MIKRITILVLTTFCVIATAMAQSNEGETPRLVVNIVVGGMQANDIERYYSNFSKTGMRKIYDEGMRYENCQYDYQQTISPVSLATLTTGAQPSTHGVVGYSWYDYVINQNIDLIADNSKRNLEYSADQKGYSAKNLIAPTLAQTLRGYSPESRTVSIALDPVSAIVMNGAGGNVFWMDSLSCNWATSTAYFAELPDWVKRHNKSKVDQAQLSNSWSPMIKRDKMINTARTNEVSYKLGVDYDSNVSKRDESRDEQYNRMYNKMANTPIGNKIVVDFVKLAVANLNLGGDKTVDLINICLDASRNVTQKYGAQSQEAEDMYYQLDYDIAELINFINAQVEDQNVVYVITSDHGTSPYNVSIEEEDNRFNSRQFEVIINGFLSARFGSGDWILGYSNSRIYLNHNLIYDKNLSLAEVQNETASFAMQFRGVSHALTATAMRSSYFGDGYGKMIQNSFYPRRSGDVIINLMPGWIEKDETRKSMSGSMYRYDRYVPLIFYGVNIPQGEVKTEIKATSLAPTIANLMNIEVPAASEGEPLKEVVKSNL